LEVFLKKLQLSDSAIRIYLNSLGKFSLTYGELFSLAPNLSKDEFETNLAQLVNGGLLFQVNPSSQKMLPSYLILPPIFPIINYYENINVNLAGIKDSIHELMINTIKQMFQQNNPIQLDLILKSFQEMKKDINEDIIIEKKEVEDAVEGMEELKNVKTGLTELNQQIKIITQTQFAALMKEMSSIQSEITEEINNLEFKKHKKEIVEIIDNKFKKKLDRLAQDFSRDLHEIIEEKFDSASKPMETLINNTFQYRDDFKLILLDMLNNFETKMNKIHNLIKKNDDKLSKEMNDFEIKIAENLDSVIQNSIDQISGLNRPAEDLMKDYYHRISSTDRTSVSNIWTINSVAKINEEIQKLLSTCEKELIIIIPKVENHLTAELFENINRSLKMKVAASEPHTNSSVKKFKNITNLIYKTLQNENLIVLKGDSDHIIIGVIQGDATDPLNDFMGIGSNFSPIIELLEPIVRKFWEEAYLDSYQSSQKSQPSFNSEASSKSGKYRSAKPITSPKVQTTEVRNFLSKKTEKVTFQTTPQPIPTSFPKPEEQVEQIKQKLQEKIRSTSAPTPKTGGEEGILINTSFNNLTQKLNDMKGEEFSLELQKVADLILEKRGFSVTLHKLRSVINHYRFIDTLLNESDIKQILENIEDWKRKLI
jgi:sugar-specific transcriptional regulator TrmB